MGGKRWESRGKGREPERDAWDDAISTDSRIPSPPSIVRCSIRRLRSGARRRLVGVRSTAASWSTLKGSIWSTSYGGNG